MDARRREGVNGRPRHGQGPTLEPNPSAVWTEWNDQRYPEGPHPSPAQGQGAEPEAVLFEDEFGSTILLAKCDWRAEDESAQSSSQKGGRRTSACRRPFQWLWLHDCPFQRHHRARSTWTARGRGATSGHHSACQRFHDTCGRQPLAPLPTAIPTASPTATATIPATAVISTATATAAATSSKRSCSHSCSYRPSSCASSHETFGPSLITSTHCTSTLISATSPTSRRTFCSAISTKTHTAIGRPTTADYISASESPGWPTAIKQPASAAQLFFSHAAGSTSSTNTFRSRCAGCSTPYSSSEHSTATSSIYTDSHLGAFAWSRPGITRYSTTTQHSADFDPCICRCCHWPSKNY